jgi:hypothetical protein
MASKLPPLPVGVAPGSGYWNDWYEKLRKIINDLIGGVGHNTLAGLQGGQAGEYYHLTQAEYAALATPIVDWPDITNTPTTLGGYGITDAQQAIQFKDEGTNVGTLGAITSIDFTGAGVTASVVGTALEVDITGGGGGGGSSLTQATGTNANVSMAANTLYILDGSILTADRTYTLPATAAVGDRVGVALSTGSSSYEVVLTAASGDTLENIAGGTEWSRLFITGEVVIMQCTVANTTWIVDQDGRKASSTRIDETSATTMSHATFTKITVDSVSFNVGNVGDSTNSRVNARRAGVYSVAAMSNVASADADTRVVVRIYVNGSLVVELTRSFNRITGATAVGSGSTLLSTNAGDYIELYALWSVSGGSGTKTTDVSAGARPFLAVNEVL